MDPLVILAQSVGLVAMLLNLLSFQQKRQNRLLILQLFGSALFAVNMFMLGALSGFLLNVLGIFRALVFWKQEKFRAKHPAWLVVFGVAYAVSYVLVFTVFEKEPTGWNLVMEGLPVIAMIVTTISFRFADTKIVRRLGLINSPLWLIYNCYCFSIGAILGEVGNLISILTAMIRLDLKKKKCDGESREKQ